MEQFSSPKIPNFTFISVKSKVNIALIFEESTNTSNKAR